MKNNISEWLFNPFKRIAGIEAFIIGLIIAVITAYISVLSNTALNGVLDMHLAKDLTLKNTLSFTAINIVSLVLVMYIAGLLLNKRFRFIDMFGTMTLSRFPFLLLALAGFLAEPLELESILSNPFIIFQSAGYILIMIITLPILVWIIVLTFQAFKTTTGAKGNKLIAVFIIGILLAEGLSKLFIYLIFNQL